MQKESNKINFFYAIKKRSFIFDMHVYRLFLYKYTKKQIYKFCRKNKIPYRDDYSNFESKYTRNIVRKSLLEKNLFLLNLTFFKVVLINFFKSFKYK
ncbi:ATP-binding protein, partial [Mycoplasmopsis synoviae]